MSEYSDRRVGAALREGFANAEAAQIPPFSRVWNRALRRVESGATADAGSGRAALSRAWQPALALAALAVVALGVVQWQRAQREAAQLQAADYALAVHLASAHGFSVPTDSLLDTGSPSLLRGAPSLPKVEYPLMPKESLL